MEQTIETKDAGSNLTRIAEYTETAAALADLRQRHQGVVYDVTIPKEMKKAKEARAEVKGYRVALEKRRVEIKAPALERCRLIDSEARRITEELVALEEPLDVQIKTEEARAEEERLARLEAERLRVEAINKRIDEIRNLPASLVGKPAVIIQGKLAKLREDVLSEDEFAEHYLTARDAHDACVARVEQLLQAQIEAEAEKRRQVERDAEMAVMSAKLVEQQRLIDEAEEAKRVEQARLEQVERDRVADEERAQREAEQRRVNEITARIDGIRCMAINLDRLHSGELIETRRALQTMHPDTSGADFAEFKDKAVDTWDTAEAALSQAIEQHEQREEAERQAADRRAEEEARLQAERERQAAEQKKLDEQAAKLKREKAEAARKAETDRLANLGLRDAAQAAVAWFVDEGHDDEQVCTDLRFALSNDTAAQIVKPARAKKAASA